MSRLPTPGADDGNWGTILNDFLVQAHNPDGTLKANAVTASSLGSGTDGQVLTKNSSQTTGINWATLDKATLGLANVDNTSDVNKPISTATQSALDTKAPLASPTFTGTVTVPTPANSTDAATKGYVDTTLASVPIYLTWTGSDYAPTNLKAVTSRPKIFAGPTDPATVSGVVLSAYDEWNQTA